MERFSLIAVILFFLSGCATEIIPTDPYHDEPKFDYTKTKYVFEKCLAKNSSQRYKS